NPHLCQPGLDGWRERPGAPRRRSSEGGNASGQPCRAAATGGDSRAPTLAAEPLRRRVGSRCTRNSWTSRRAGVIIRIDRAAGVVTKKAETRAEVSRLRREAAVLSLARHPGVVELIGLTDPDELRLRSIEGPCLAEYLCDGGQPWTEAELLAFGA